VFYKLPQVFRREPPAGAAPVVDPITEGEHTRAMTLPPAIRIAFLEDLLDQLYTQLDDEDEVEP